MSEEETSSATDNDIDTDEEVDDTPNLEMSTSSELVHTPHGLCFTPSDYAEMKLLKLMDDVQALHFLYQDVLNWAMEAKQLHYNFFCPQCTTGYAQIIYIEK
jgi:hypothetical protein